MQRSREAEGDGIAGRRCSRGTFQNLPLPQTPAARRLKYFWLDLTQVTFRLLSSQAGQYPVVFYFGLFGSF